MTDVEVREARYDKRGFASGIASILVKIGGVAQDSVLTKGIGKFTLKAVLL